MEYRIAIIGAGPIGRAIEKLLTDARHAPRICDKDAAKATACVPANVAVPEANVVFLCVPSWSVRAAAEEIAPMLQPGAIVVALAKGVEEGTGAFVPDILAQVLPAGTRTAMLCGPMLASEIMDGLASGAVVGTADRATYDALAEVFAGSGLLLRYSADVRGVAVASVLKNVYAVGLGIIMAMELGRNCQGLYLEEAARECKGLMARFGGQPETFDGLAGLGDLVATAFSERSRNRTAGEQIVRTGAAAVRSEGAGSLPFIVRALGGDVQRYRILEGLHGVVAANRNARAEFGRMFRPR